LLQSLEAATKASAKIVDSPPESRKNNEDLSEIDPITPQVTHLENTLSNLKWGFKKREEGLKQQLHEHKNALQFLYSNHERLRKKFR
jgi:archaellum component FlaC